MMTVIFDLGKTNKKCFVFDEDFREVWRSYVSIPEITDEDCFPCDDLPAITEWMRTTADALLTNNEFILTHLNFSTYGASFVHLDKAGKPVTPLYNYLKPYPPELLEQFTRRYGDVARATGSPESGFLNSGLQLYWLKHRRPKVWERIRWSLHLPQYCSYLFTGIPVSDYTSVGCHTSLWDYARRDYHAWVYAEGIDRKLPPLVTAGTSLQIHHQRHKLSVGVGIHDSSSALLPYLRADRKPFLLISTGTWSIALNPFATNSLTDEDIRSDTLQYMRLDGHPVRATRLFLGHEYAAQVRAIAAHFGVGEGGLHKLPFNEQLYQKTTPVYRFRFDELPMRHSAPPQTVWNELPDAPTAYFQMMRELTDYQIRAARMAIGDTVIHKLYIDGGFADNQIFVRLLARAFPRYKIRTTKTPLGSALGAAVAVNDAVIGKRFLKRNYGMRKVVLLGR